MACSSTLLGPSSSSPLPPSLAVLLAAAALAALSGCREAGAAPSPVAAVERAGERLVLPEGSPLRRRVRVEPAEKRDVRRRLTVPASVEAEGARLARIAPPLAGRIARLHVKFGDQVKAGTPLFELTSPDMVAAQTDYLRAQSALGQAERNVARQRDLAEHGIGAKRELEQVETDRELCVRELDRARMRISIIGGGMSFAGGSLTVASPISGRVVDLACAPGEFRNDASVPLLTVADLSRVWVTANVAEKDIRLVHRGDDASATFVAYPGDKLDGHVELVGDLLDAETRTIKVRITLENPGERLKPGMFATATFSGPPTPSVVVPTSALVLVGDKSYLFVEVAPFTFERRAATLGEQDGDATVVVQGLDEGARVLTQGAVFLQG